PDKSKLSKRQGDVAVEDYRAKGYLKEALVNFVAFLGWNPGDEREIFTIEELIKEFSLERVGKAGAVFNIEKLDWFQEQHLRAKPEAEALGMLKEELKKSKFADKNFDDGYLLKVIQAMRERAAFVRDFVEKSPYFFEPPKEYDESVVKKRWKPETSGQLLTLLEEFSKLNNPTKEDFEWALNGTAGQFNIGAGELIHPLRLSLTGVAIGPGVYDIAEVLGKDETIKRIKKAIEKIK
ncbi:MAG TPA: glutamate--tRNA ligase family protein, partial [Bacteroidota bacterium]